MALKTMQEIRNTTEIYPTSLNITTAEQNAINSWFDLRYVSDNDNFVTFFQRVLIRDYGRYKELLRIEPNISKFDWLVQQYNESQTFEKGSDVTGTNGTTTGQNTTTGTTTGTTTDNTTDNTTTSGTHTHNGSGTDTSTGTSTQTNSGTDTTTHSAENESTTDTTAQASGTDTTTTDGHTNNKSLTRENPMSISYNSGMSIDGNSNTGVLDWQYPSAQSEQDTRTDDTTATRYGRKDSTDTTQNSTSEGTDALRHGHVIEDESTGTTTRIDNDTDNETGNSLTTHINTGTTNGTTNSTATNTTTNSAETVANKQHITQHINTGRSVDTATLLVQAQAYIMNSSAMQWLCSRLEPCFMGVYNDSADDYLTWEV